ncbi:hypothetical protein [Actinomyces ruminicola]|uniref:hypothetical protein n=1 Tax=Actinomyces ruminicola TaxID=332524 RepID=UPI0011CABABC|nr:hypothetical protein [Actinomyces ruminicola]
MDDSIIDVTFHLQRLGRRRGKVWRRRLLHGLSPETGIDLVNAIADDSYVLTISDRGTRGLGGPFRADEAVPDGVHSDFVQFLRNVGEASDHKLGGGTYGFGKGILFNSSSAGVILVDTNCVQSMGAPRRFMGAALGSKFMIGNRPYTGRHWFGTTGDDGVIDPITGADAEAFSAALGMPGFRNGCFGTDISIVGLRLGTDNGTSGTRSSSARTPEQALRVIANSITWNLWPKMGSSHRPEQIRFRATLDGREFPIPSPSDDPVLSQFIGALDDLTAGRGIQVGRKTVEPKHLGDLVLRPTVSDLTPAPALAGEGCPIEAPLHHVCRMRQAQLVVDYFRLETHPDERLGYLGVFRGSPEADHLFAESEPPTHDFWAPRGNSSNTNGAVMTTNAIIRKSAREMFASRERTSRATTVPGLGSVAANLSPLLAGIHGTGASVSGAGRSRTSTSRRSGARKPTVKVLEPAHVAFDESGPVIVTQVQISAGVRPSVIVAVEQVILDDGAIEDPSDAPADSTKPAILKWRSVAGQIVDGDTLRLPERTGGRWTIVARYLPDCAVTIQLKVDEDET